MRQVLAAVILGAVLAVTASAAFADERSGGVYVSERFQAITLSKQAFSTMPGRTLPDHLVYDSR